MSLDPPSYVVSLLNNIRCRPMSWEGAVRAKTITDSHHKKIKAIDKVRKEQRKEVLDKQAGEYVELWLGNGAAQSVVQSAIKRQDMIVYLLVLLDDSIQDSPALLDALLKHGDPFAPFLPLVQSSSGSGPDEAVPLLSSLVLTKLLSQSLSTSRKPPKNQEAAVKSLYKYLSTLAKSPDSGHQDIAVQSYSSLLKTKQTRQLFWDQRKETIDPLIDILKAAAGAGKDTRSTLWSEGATTTRANLETGISGGVGIQLLYRVLLVIWQLSFQGELVGEGLQDEHDILIIYVQLLRISPKEKITRLLLSTLHNLLKTNTTTLIPSACLARLPSLLQTLKAKHLSDLDLLEDLDSLSSMLEDYTKTQTTFDSYAAELRSGHLRWSPPHRNPVFWAENARRILDENKGELPKLLAQILSKSWENDKQVLAIGCNDVACLVKEVPEKRPALEKMGLKTRVMELMQDSNETVRWESLRAVGEWLRYSFN